MRRELRESRARAGKTFRVQESSGACAKYRTPLRNALCVAVLGRVRSFLPQLAAAEVEVVDIEDVSEDEPHIALVGSFIVMRSLYFCMYLGVKYSPLLLCVYVCYNTVYEHCC